MPREDEADLNPSSSLTNSLSLAPQDDPGTGAAPARASAGIFDLD
jgi:hypothetical protein